MTQIFFLGCDDSWQQLQQVSDTALTDDARLPAATNAALVHSLSNGDSVVVLYNRPQRIIAALLSQLSLSDALSQWQQNINQLLAVQRRYRRQLSLLCLDDVLLSQPTAALAADITALLAKLTPAPASLADLVAAAAISAQPEYQQLASVLQASTLPTQEQAGTNIADWVNEYRTLNQHSAQLPLLQQQQQQLQQQLELVQQELEVVFAEKQQMQLKITPLQHELAQQKAEQDRLQREVAEQKTRQDTLSLQLSQSQNAEKQTKEENELLLTQLLQVQEELEKYYLQYKAQAAELDKQNAALAQQQQQSRQLETELKQVQELNSSKQQQLLQLQQTHSNALRDATAKQNNTTMLQKQAERELTKAQAEIEKLQRQLAGASLTGHQAMAELKTVKNSTIWKAMAPVRKFSSSAKKKQLQLQKDISLVRSCPLFDSNWYLQSYPDVEQSGADPIEHYIKYGAKEGRAPGPDFDGNWYLSHYPDVAGSGINPLVHYIKFGQLEGRQTSPKLLQLKRTS